MEHPALDWHVRLAAEGPDLCHQLDLGWYEGEGTRRPTVHLDDGRNLAAHATDLCWSVLRLQGTVQYKLYKHEDLCLDP